MDTVSNPPEYTQEVTLLDGTQATLRPICAADKEALLSFHSRLSEETLFLRYHYFKGQLNENDLKTLCEVDYVNTLALVAEVRRNGHKEIIGVGRFIRLPTDHTAEVAFTVQDSEQNKGLGTHLLKHLAILAQQRDVRYFYGEVLRNNGKMLTIFRKSDPEMKQEIDSPSTCTVTLSIGETLNQN